MAPFGKIKPNVEFTTVSLLVSPKNAIVFCKTWVDTETCAFLQG